VGSRVGLDAMKRKILHSRESNPGRPARSPSLYLFSVTPIMKHRESVKRFVSRKFLNRPCRSSAVRRWLPTAAAGVRVRAACGVCDGQSGTGAGFLRVLRFPLPIIPPISPLS
jgi:hypothetical protein